MLLVMRTVSVVVSMSIIVVIVPRVRAHRRDCQPRHQQASE